MGLHPKMKFNWKRGVLAGACCAAAALALVTANSLAASPRQEAQQSTAPANPTAAPQNAQPQDQQQTAPGPDAAQAHAIKAETREVRVDVVVTDKKGNYITDLTEKDFKVYEDNKEQPINSFSFGANPNGPTRDQRHYLVLFFDTTTMDLSDQPRARAAAGKFIEAHAGPDQVMSVMNFGGSLQIVQNFTTDSDRLMAAVKNTSFAHIDTANASSGTDALQYPGMANFANVESSFGTYTLLLSIRNLAKNLAAIPGRKSLILFTGGFELNNEAESELTATIDACNKANVAVYPLDVRGLAAPTLGQNRAPVAPGAANGANAANTANVPANAIPFAPSSSDVARAWDALATANAAAAQNSSPSFQFAAFHFEAEPLLAAAFQHGGGGGGGGHAGGGGAGGGGGTGGGTGGGSGGGKGGGGGTGTGTGTGGGTGGKGGTGGSGGSGTGGGGSRGGGGGIPYYNNPLNQARNIVPSFPPSASTNQQVMYQLASGTGGFTILNTNDLLPGLEKIAREQDHYYLLGYAPTDSKEGACHTLKVKVEHGGANVRSRSGFCNVAPADPLIGKPVEKELEARATAASGTSATNAAAGAAPTVTAGAIQAPYFYTAANEAQVHVAMEVPSSDVHFEKVKGKYHADVNVLGIAYKPDGTVASRFSDELTFDLEKPEWEAFQKAPMHYENQFAIVPGTYRLSVAMGGGADKFGTYQTPLVIDPYDGKKLTVSGLFLSKQMLPTTDDGGVLEADLLADKTPFIVHHVQLTPAGEDRFKKADKVALYAQIYAPQITAENPPTVRVSFVVTDPKGQNITGATKLDVASFVQKGSPTIPVALRIPVDAIPPGQYKLQFQANIDGGGYSQIRSIPFTVE